jgi:hypothetical protein
MGDIGQRIAGGIAAVFTLATLAIIISTKANTPNVLGAFFGGLANLIGVAISPVTGQTVSGLGASSLTGATTDTGAWTVPITNFAGTSGTLGNASNILGGINNLVTGGTTLVNNVGKLFGGSGGSGSGSGNVDSGSFDSSFGGGGGGFDSGGGSVDSGPFDVG